jgi:hypothetical protein
VKIREIRGQKSCQSQKSYQNPSSEKKQKKSQKFFSLNPNHLTKKIKNNLKNRLLIQKKIVSLHFV